MYMYSLIPRPSEVISMVLLYGAVSWIMTKQLERLIPRRCLHKALVLCLKCVLGLFQDQPRALQWLITSIHVTEETQTGLHWAQSSNETLRSPATTWHTFLGTKWTFLQMWPGSQDLHQNDNGRHWMDQRKIASSSP